MQQKFEDIGKKNKTLDTDLERQISEEAELFM